MTFIIKHRGAGGLIVAEYVCPVHGRFEATVQRDGNGDPPSEQPCPKQFPAYKGDEHAADLDEPCLASSPWTISAPKQKVWSVPATAAVRGGDMKERPPWMLDTRPLGDGMPYSEWRAKQDKLQQDRRRQQLIDNGMVQKKVIVGG